MEKYNIKIKTKEGTYEYEDELYSIETYLEKHRNEGDIEVKADKEEKCKKKVLKKH